MRPRYLIGGCEPDDRFAAAFILRAAIDGPGGIPVSNSGTSRLCDGRSAPMI
jgi:hypothetical protein